MSSTMMRDVEETTAAVAAAGKDLAPASYKKKRKNRKKAPKTSHSSLDNDASAAQPGAYRATTDASRRLKASRESRASRATTAASVTTKTTAASDDADVKTSLRNSANKSDKRKKKNDGDCGGKQQRKTVSSKTSTRSTMSQLEGQQQGKHQRQPISSQPSTTSTLTPPPISLERQMYRHAEPGAQAIPGSRSHLVPDGDEESGYSFTPEALSESTSLQHAPRDGLTVDGDLTEARMVDDVEVYRDPVYAETIDMEQQKLTEQSKRRKYALWGFLAATAVGIAIALAVVLTRPSTATEPPTMAPSFAELDRALFLRTLSDPLDLDNATSPQARASAWIVDEDEIFRNLTSSQLQQRYALAVLYFATNGDTAWTTTRNWLSPAHSICEWTQSGTNVCDPDTVLLREFTMDRNGMEGTIPTELAHLSESLSVLDLTINGIGGTLPTEMATMTLLQTFHLSHNKLSGTVPTELGLLTNVRQLYVDGNDFTATMPQDICQLKTVALEKLWADCLPDTPNGTADIQCEPGCCRCCSAINECS